MMRSTCLMACLLLVTAHELVAGTLPIALTFPDTIGVQYGGGFGEKDAEKIANDLGVAWVRIEVGWSSVERVKGQYNFEGFNKLVAMLAKNSLRPLIILNYGNPIWQKTDDPADDLFTGPTTPEAREAYARYCGATAKHFAEVFPQLPIVYELWNEPDYQLFWRPKPNVEAYVEMVKAAAANIHAAVPEVSVIGPATMSSRTPFVTKCIELGILDHLDGFSVHPYRRTKDGKGSPETVIPDYQKVHDLMRVWFAAKGQPGKSLPIVESEWGYSECALPGGAAVTPVQQAEYVTRMWLTNVSQGVVLSIWFQWQSGDNPTDVWSHCGLIRADGSERPSYVAAKTLLKSLKGSRFMERVDKRDDAIFILKFIGDNELPTFACWTTGAEIEVENPVQAESQVISMMGETSTHNGGMLKLTTSPQYVRP